MGLEPDLAHVSVLKMYYNGSWVEVGAGATGPTGPTGPGFDFYAQDAQPAGGAEGDLWLDTDATPTFAGATGPVGATGPAGATAPWLYLGNSSYRESFSVWIGSTNIPIAPTGNMNLVGMPLYAGDVISNLAFVSGATALTMGSNNDGHLWFALYDTTATLMAQTADQGGSATWAANSIKALALAAPVTITTTGWYYAAVMVAAGTGGSPVMPTLRGNSVANGVFTATAGWPTGRKVIVAINGTGLTTTAPAGPLTLTSITNAPYVLAY